MVRTWLSQKRNRQSVFLTVFFAVYMFEYMTTLTFIDKNSAAVFAGRGQLSLHYIDTVLVVLGFIAFALFRRLPEKAWLRRILPLFSSAAYGISTLLLFFLKDIYSYSAAAMCASLFLGVLGGMVYFCMAMALTDSPQMGRVMVLGNCAAVIMQFLFQEYFNIAVGLPIMLVLGFCAVLYLTYRSPWDWLKQDFLPYDTPDPEKRRSLFQTLTLMIIISVCLYCIGNIYDRQMLLLNVESGYTDFNLYSWPRLCVIPGMMIVGCLTDLSRGRSLAVSTLCVAMVAILNPVLFGDSRYYAFNMCLFYINLGASLAYYNLAFWRIAPKTKWPELWSGMGRIVTGLTSLLLLLAPFDKISMAGAVALDIVMFDVIVVCMFAGGEFSFKNTTAKKPEERTLSSYCQLHSFTPRESEVFEKIVFSEDIGEKLADDLKISRRVLQRYIASIYEKTGTKTRAGLCQSFLRYQMGEAAEKPE